jgi:glycosyltransferase involved in cell wall biosynthesis
VTAVQRPPRVTHLPVNTAGIPWANVQALRARGVDARLVVFERYRLHPEADREIARPSGLLGRQLAQARAFARLAPGTDVFHFYFGLTLLPKSVQFPLLRALGKRSVMHFLGSDIRGRTPAELEWSRRAGARVVGSYDAIRWVPDAHVIPPGIDVTAIEPSPPSDRARPVVVHAPSSRARKGTEHVIAACEQLDVELELIEGLDHREAFERYRNADLVVDQLYAGWYGVFAIEAMALGKPVVTFLHDDAARRTEEAFGIEVPLVPATKETLADVLRPLAASPEERRRIGAASRAYVERVHDLERVADRLLDLYAGLQ